MAHEIEIAMPAGVAHITEYETREARKVSWGAIFAGVVIALGVMVLLGLFGAGLGFAIVDPRWDRAPLAGMGIGSAIYFVIAQLISLFIGGYAAARLSANHDPQKAILHGATVWALATLVTIWIATSTAGALLNTGYSAVKNSMSALQQAGAAVIPNDIDLPSFSAPDFTMASLPPRIQNALRAQGVTAENLKAEAREAFRNVISKREQSAARDVAVSTATDIIRSPSDAVADINAGIEKLIGTGGVLSEEDRKEFMAVMERRLGITPAEAEETVNRWQAEAKQTFDRAQAAVADARAQVLQAAQTATNTLAQASFWAGIASLLALGAAVAGSAAGRRDTDPVLT